MKGSYSAKAFSRIFEMTPASLSGAADLSIPACGEKKGLRRTAVSGGRRRAKWTRHPGALSMCAALMVILLGGPMRGYSQTVVATVPAGLSPYAVAVNPATNKIYVPNLGSDSVTVIDGATNNTATVQVGVRPVAAAVNPVTNKIYVVNYFSATVSVIDGATNNTTTVTVGPGPTDCCGKPGDEQDLCDQYRWPARRRSGD